MFIAEVYENTDRAKKNYLKGTIITNPDLCCTYPSNTPTCAHKFYTHIYACSSNFVC